ncbi:DNA excision repair protein ERCC-1 [Sitophilus oryzae]|uniref:DNA excision repair protein ERCC-1 n=1 Tax=Sitophilus oryzae TaxID=7048 RepID=A0A6J2YQA9_SITOR|nr:DNA excision repair protein ERCC-1 [Sitophilus oryzae]
MELDSDSEDDLLAQIPIEDYQDIAGPPTSRTSLRSKDRPFEYDQPGPSTSRDVSNSRITVSTPEDIQNQAGPSTSGLIHRPKDKGKRSISDSVFEDVPLEGDQPGSSTSKDVQNTSKVSKAIQNKPGASRPTEQITAKSKGGKNSLLVNPNQRGNPLLKSITRVVWEFEEIVPDYQMGVQMCALFLSIKYHNLKPDYIHERLKQLKDMYKLRVLLVLVDVKDPHYTLKNLTRMCILADLTLILAWSSDEAGKILETYKMYENKPPDLIMGKSESAPYLKIIQALTTIKPINKTDAMNLLSRFNTLEGIIKASEFQISECPGIGPKKAKRLYNVLRENFCK